MKNDRTLILGSAVNLDESHLFPFLNSLYQTDFGGKVVFYVSQINNSTIVFLNKMKVEMIHFDYSQLKGIMPIHAFRYFLFQKYLYENEHHFDYVMLTDTRDVIFQMNPFNFQIEDYLCLFLEDESQTIGGCRFNSNWICSKFGAAELEKLSACKISCSGITIGSCAKIQFYLSQMTKYLMPAINLVGYDQGVHNYLLYNNLLKGVKLIENNAGSVLTMGNMNAQKIRYNNLGKIINNKDGIVNILHQYDRHQAFKNLNDSEISTNLLHNLITDFR